MLHVDDNEEIKVVHHAEGLHDLPVHPVSVTRGTIQPVTMVNATARYT